MDLSEAITAIYAFPVPADQGDITALLQKMIASYLVHNGYSKTAEAFARISDQQLSENMFSIRKRQNIMKLAMAGKMGQAMELTARIYPGVLESNKNLMFMLKCRRFIEMINGTDSMEITPTIIDSKTTSTTPTNDELSNHSGLTDVNQQLDVQNSPHQNAATPSKPSPGADYFNDVDMDLCYNAHGIGSSNLLASPLDADEDIDIVVADFDRILAFGKDLMRMGTEMDTENLLSDEERQMMEDAFSLIAYSNPRSSSLCWQFHPNKREIVCSVLNSAILRSMGQPWRPSLEVCLAHASELLKLVAQFKNDAHKFVNIEDVFPNY